MTYSERIIQSSREYEGELVMNTNATEEDENENNVVTGRSVSNMRRFTTSPSFVSINYDDAQEVTPRYRDHKRRSSMPCIPSQPLNPVEEVREESDSDMESDIRKKLLRKQFIQTSSSTKVKKRSNSGNRKVGK